MPLGQTEACVGLLERLHLSWAFTWAYASAWTAGIRRAFWNQAAGLRTRRTDLGLGRGRGPRVERAGGCWSGPDQPSGLGWSFSLVGLVDSTAGLGCLELGGTGQASHSQK